LRKNRPEADTINGNLVIRPEADTILFNLSQNGYGKDEDHDNLFILILMGVAFRNPGNPYKYFDVELDWRMF